jgi:hypothetical protein
MFAHPKGFLIQLQCLEHCINILSYISSPTKSDLGWPTLSSKAVTVISLKEWYAGHKLLTIKSKALITKETFDH